MLSDLIDRPPVLTAHLYLVTFFAAKMLTFSVFRGMIDIVHSDDPFVWLSQQLPFYHGFVTMDFLLHLHFTIYVIVLIRYSS